MRERSSAPPRLARVASDVAAAPQTGGDVVTREVNRRIEETISNAPAVYRQWNDRFGWWAKYQLRLDEWELTRQLEVRVRLYCNTQATVKDGWTRAILAKWSNKFSFAVLRDTPIVNRAGGVDDVLESYPIRIRIEWVDDPARAHYVLTANEPGAREDGRAGTDGTTSMTGWGKTDRTDVPHEFGHILGCPEEYFTTNGVDYTRGGTERGYRDEDGGVMNNPSGPAMARNFQTIRIEAAAMRGVPLNRTRVQ